MHEVKGMRQIPDDVFRKSANGPVQGSSSDILLYSMVRIKQIIDRYVLPVKMILTVHDSIVFEGPEDQLISTIVCEMNSICASDIPNNFKWLRVPMRFEYLIGPNWGELEEKGQMWG